MFEGMKGLEESGGAWNRLIIIAGIGALAALLIGSCWMLSLCIAT